MYFCFLYLLLLTVICSAFPLGGLDLLNLLMVGLVMWVSLANEMQVKLTNAFYEETALSVITWPSYCPFPSGTTLACPLTLEWKCHEAELKPDHDGHSVVVTGKNKIWPHVESVSFTLTFASCCSCSLKGYYPHIMACLREPFSAWMLNQITFAKDSVHLWIAAENKKVTHLGSPFQEIFARIMAFLH